MKKADLQEDLLASPLIKEKVKNEAYAQNLYAALCNNSFVRNELFPILREEEWSCSWRFAGKVVATLRQKGDYIDWYCSGIQGDYPSEKELKEFTPEQLERLEITKNFVDEGYVTDEIKEDLMSLGWKVYT